MAGRTVVNAAASVGSLFSLVQWGVSVCQCHVSRSECCALPSAEGGCRHLTPLSDGSPNEQRSESGHGTVTILAQGRSVEVCLVV
jgi:hypothetical protein